MRLVPFTEYVLKLLAATALYTFSSRYLLDFFAPSGVVSLFYIASGIGLATVLIGGNRYAASIFFGQTLSVMLGGLPLTTAMGMGMGCTLGTIAGASWLKYKTDFDLSLTTLSDWLQLILWGGCFACGINAIIGVSSLFLGGFIKPDEFFSKIITWWLGDMLGVMVITPFALLWWQVRQFSMTAKQLAEVLLLVSLTFLVGLVIFLDWFHDYVGQVANTYWMFLLIIWVTVRLEAHWVSLVVLITSMQALQGVYSDLGIFNSDFTESKELNYWFYIIVLSSVGMTLSIFITTNKRVRIAQQEALDRLQKIASSVSGMVYSFRLNTDGSFCFPYASAAIEDIYRVTPEDVRENAAKVFAILHPDDYAQVADSINASAQNLTPWRQEYRVRFEDNTERWLSGNALPQREQDGAILWHGFITDITERKRIEVAEQQQHALLLNVINSLSHPFYVVNTDDYTVQLANESAGHWLKGITTCYQLSHKQDPCVTCTIGKHPCPIDEVKRTKKPLTVEHLHYDENGRPRRVEVFAYPIFDAAGEVHQLIEYVIDITERTQSQNEILAAKNELQATLDAIPDLLFELDLEGRYHNFHAPRTELLVAPPEQFLGKTIADILPPDAAAICFSALQEAQRQGWSIGKQIKLELDQGTHWFELSVAVKQIENVQQPHFIVLSRDITDRKLSEIAIAESQKLLRTIIDTTPIRVFWKDCNLYYLGCNKLFAEDAGMTDPNDIVGKNDYQMGWAEQAELYRADDRIVMDSNIAKLSYDEPQTTPSGEKIWLRTSKVPLKNQNNELIGLLGVYEDITERKQVEVELKRSNAELEQFAYAVSHDMRQPLRMVTSYLSLIETALATQLDEDTRQFIHFAIDGAKRMDAMILSLLDYSRVGRRTKPLSLISSRAAVDEALAFLEPEVKISGGHVDVTGDWVELYASRDELTRLLQNLIGNALKYHEENKPPCVEVRAIVTANTFKVGVRDSGIGIDPSQIDRLFKVFSRLQARTRFEGTGVGLALCRKIVEHHGGQIGVESAGEGQGCVFWFELPLLQPSHTRKTKE